VALRENLGKLRQYWNWGRFKRNVAFFLKNDFNEGVIQLKDQIVEDCVYELEDAKRVLPKLNVLSSDETFALLKAEPKSYARFGDGEISVMEGGQAIFQEPDPLLAMKLRDVLEHPRDDLYVGLNAAYFQTPFRFGERNHRFYRLHNSEYRKYFLSHCDPSATYLDASCFGAYFRYKDDFDYAGHYAKVKGLFDGKRLVVVAGEGVLEKLEYDVFEGAESVKRVYGPARDAYAEYERILQDVRDVVEDGEIVCLVLGVAATVMAADLAAEGYVAWDIGHAAKDYDAYMRGIEKTEENMEKFWAPD